MGARRPFFLERDMSTAIYSKERALSSEIAPAVERSVPGVEVLAVELLSPSRFCVYIDHPNGVDHALCERVTYVLDAYRDDYTIDVSSPGPERPLRTRAHFARALGLAVSVKAEGLGRKRVRGRVVEAAEDEVAIAVPGAAEPLHIPYDAIVRANLIDEGLTT
jgi:ribosome maturation factor RimP